MQAGESARPHRALRRCIELYRAFRRSYNASSRLSANRGSRRSYKFVSKSMFFDVRGMGR